MYIYIYNDYQVILVSWISLTLYPHPFLLSIVLKTAVSVSTKLTNISLFLFTDTRVSMYWSSEKNIAFDFIPAFLAIQHVLFFFALLGWFVRWELSGHTTAFLWVGMSRICSILRTGYLCSSHLAFSVRMQLKSSGCRHTVVVIRLYLQEIPLLF